MNYLTNSVTTRSGFPSLRINESVLMGLGKAKGETHSRERWPLPVVAGYGLWASELVLSRLVTMAQAVVVHLLVTISDYRMHQHLAYKTRNVALLL